MTHNKEGLKNVIVHMKIKSPTKCFNLLYLKKILHKKRQFKCNMQYAIVPFLAHSWFQFLFGIAGNLFPYMYNNKKNNLIS